MTEKADFLKSTAEGGSGDFETRNLNNIAKGFIIICPGGSQKDMVLMNTGFAFADMSFGMIFEGFVVVGAGDS